MNRCFHIMGLIVCCAAMSAKARDEEAPPPGRSVESLSGKQSAMELSVQPAAAPEPIPPPPETRDPFWPVGYIPPPDKVDDSTTNTSEHAVVVTQSEPLWDGAIKTLIVKGIMKSGAGYIAVINGQLMSENDTISSVYKGRTYRWRIAKISEKGVQFERLELSQ